MAAREKRNPEDLTTWWDHQMIEAMENAMDNEFGRDDDIERFKERIQGGASKDKFHTACRIAISFVRKCQDLERELRN